MLLRSTDSRDTGDAEIVTPESIS